MTNKINGERSMTHKHTPVYIILSLMKGKLKDIQGKNINARENRGKGIGSNVLFM